MNKLRIYLLTAVGIAILGTAVTFTTTGQALAQGAMKALLVRDVENPARLAFQDGGGYALGEGESHKAVELVGGAQPYTSGKRLVIEYVTVRALVPPGQKVWAQINTPLGGQFNFHSLEMVSQGVFDGQEVFVGSHQTRIYADPPADFNTEIPLHINFFRSSDSGTGEVAASIAGHLVNLN